MGVKSNAGEGLRSAPAPKLLSGYNSRGEEIPDSRPVAVHVGFERPVPLGERIRRLVANEVLNRELGGLGVETFEEADDFDVAEDPVDPKTPYEDDFEPGMPGFAARQAEIRSGFVEDVPVDRIGKAGEVVSKAKKPKGDTPPAPLPAPVK